MVPGLGAGKEAPIKIKIHTPWLAPMFERSERRITWQGLRPACLFRAQCLPPLLHMQGKKIKLVWLRQVFYFFALDVLNGMWGDVLTRLHQADKSEGCLRKG
jgi:hypothetical protein